MSDTPAWSIDGDCARIRTVARAHGFMIRSYDARKLWEGRSREGRSTWLPLPESDAALFEAILKPLHEWLAADDEPVPSSQEMDSPGGRPTLIDESDGKCPICAGWEAHKYGTDGEGHTVYHCDNCGCDLPLTPMTGGRGIQGVAPHHYHLRMINGTAPGREGIHQELCLECAIALRLKVYPPDVRDRYGNLNPDADEMRRGITVTGAGRSPS